MENMNEEVATNKIATPGKIKYYMNEKASGGGLSQQTLGE